MLYFFTKVMGFFTLGAGLTVWWMMATSILAGKIDATTKGGELWFTRVDSTTAFWVTVLVYFLGALIFFGTGCSLLRKDKLPPPSE